jgi:hypothetical protein
MNTVRLKPEIEEKMRVLAGRLGVTVSDIHRTAIEEYLSRELKSGVSSGADGGPTISIWDSVIGVVGGSDNVKAQTGQRIAESSGKKRARSTG